jgi:type II secretion system protein J
MTSRPRGFTLLEVLVASTIFALIAAAAFVFLDTSRRLDERIRFKSEIYQTGRAVLGILQRDLSAAYAWGKFGTGIVGRDAVGEEGDADEIELVSANHSPASDLDREIDLARIIYVIDPEHGLLRQKLTRLTAEQEVIRSEDISEQLSARIVGMNVRYHDGSGWTDSWDTPSTKTMPKAIEVTLTVSAEYHGRAEKEVLKTSFWLASGASYVAPEEEPADR